MSLLRARTRRLPRPPQALALLLPGLGVGVLAALHFRGGESVATTATVGAVSVLVGAVLARWISRADRDPATRYLIGLAIAGVAIAVRVSPLMFGSVNEVIVIDRGVVVGEIAAVLAIIGIGTMLSTMIEVERHVSRQHALQRPVTRAVALCLAVSPLIPFALASSGDLGPLVILVVAVSAMAGRSINGVWFIVLTALVLTWVALLAVTTIDIARERLADTLSGGFQLDLARLAISYGGLVWGGGFGANAFAESIPVASTDHLAAYLAGSIGVIPFIFIVGCALAALALAARALARPATALTVAATGLVVAASVQTGWALLGSFGALPLTGVPLPGLSVSGSSWAAWGIALGLIGAALRRRRDERPMAGLRLAAAQPAARVIGSTVVFTALAAPVIAFVVAVSLIAFPSASGATGALSTVAPRGSIVTSDGVVLAVTGEDGTRRYPLGSAAVETVGLVVPLVNQYGLERSASALLTCAGGGFGAVLLAGVVGPRCSPATVMTTLDSGLQTAAVSAASGPAGGSIIVMRVSTLDVLAAYSLDPGAARPDPNAVATGDLAIEEVSPLEPASSFYPAIFEEAISPGSIFKVPVLAATAELGFAGSLGSVDPGELGVENSWYGPCPSNDIPSAIAYSCNTVTAEIAQAVGQASLSTALSTYFGLDADERLIDGRLAPAGATALPGAPMTTGELSRTVIGLQSVRLTMLDLAAVVAHSVGASPGASPTLVAGTCTPGMWSPSPSPLGGTAVGEPLSASTVTTIREGMALAVVDGTASSLLAGVIGDTGDLEVLAKTGTPDREVDGVSVNDSLIVVIVDDYLILTRIQGTPENPTPDEDSPAMTLAQDMLSALLAGWDRLEAAPVCPAATNGEAGS